MFLEKKKQQGETINQDAGERALWASVIIDAFKALDVNPNMTHRGCIKIALMERNQAVRFFTSSKSNFEWICQSLDLNADNIRRQAIKKANIGG